GTSQPGPGPARPVAAVAAHITALGGRERRGVPVERTTAQEAWQWTVPEAVLLTAGAVRRTSAHHRYLGGPRGQAIIGVGGCKRWSAAGCSSGQEKVNPSASNSSGVRYCEMASSPANCPAMACTAT